MWFPGDNTAHNDHVILVSLSKWLFIFILPSPESYFRPLASHSPIVAVGLAAKAKERESSRNSFLLFFFLFILKPMLEQSSCNFDLIPSLLVKHWWLSLHRTQIKLLCLTFKDLHSVPWPIYLVFSIIGPYTQGRSARFYTESLLSSVQWPCFKGPEC